MSEAKTIAQGEAATDTRAAARPRLPPPRGIVVRTERRWSAPRVVATQLGILVLTLGLWELGVRAGRIDPFFWSQPSAIWRTAIVFVTQGSALYDTWFTVSATLVGFLIGTVSGAAVGLSFWWSRNVSAVLEPFVIVFHAVPKLAFAPLIILLFGIGISSKIALAIALTMVISILAAHGGVKAVDDDLVRLMYTLGASRRQVFTKVVIPSSMPWIISSMRINIGMALAGTIVGEFVSSQHGLGKLILYAGSTYEMALIWVGIIVLSAVAVGMYAAVIRLERVLLRGVRAQVSE
jgi:NitT/TauT family transport system permease protein